MTGVFQGGEGTRLRDVSSARARASAAPVPPLWYKQWTPHNTIVPSAFFLNATHRVDMEEASPATSLGDSIGSLSLVLDGDMDTDVFNGIVTKPLETEVRASRGLSWGDLFTGAAVATSTALVDMGGADSSMGLRFLFCLWRPPTVDLWIAHKWDGSAGFSIEITTGGLVRINVEDGVEQATLTGSVRVDDGGIHYIEVVFNKTDEQIEARTDLEVMTPVDMSLLTWTDITHTDPFAVADSAQANLTGGVLKYLGVFFGSAAEALTDQSESAFFTHGQDPDLGDVGEWSRGFGEAAGPLANSGTLYATVWTDDDSYEFIPWSPNQWAVGRDNRGKSIDWKGSGYGLFNVAIQQEMQDGELVESSWTLNGTTAVSAAPSDVARNLWGIKGARRVVAGAANDSLDSPTFNTSGIGTIQMHGWLSVKRDSSTDTTILIELIRQGDMAVLASVNPTLTDDDWHTYVLDTGIGETTDQIYFLRITFDTAGEPIHLCGIVGARHQHPLAITDVVGVPCPAWGVSSATFETDGRVQKLLSTELEEAGGEIIAGLSAHTPNATTVAYRTYDWRNTGVPDPEGSGLLFRRDLRMYLRQNSDDWKFRQYRNNNDVLVFDQDVALPDPADITKPHHVRYFWRPSTPLFASVYAHMIIETSDSGIVTQDLHSSSWVFGAGVEEIELGREFGSSFGGGIFQGLIGRVEIYSQAAALIRLGV